MNLTPHWKQIQQTHPDAHFVLQRVASAIYKQAERSITFRACEADLAIALELGFLSSEGDQITFSNSEVECDYLVRHAVVLALADWDDLKEFTRVISEVEKVSIKIYFQSEIEAGMLLVLCYEHGKNIVDRIVELIRQENSEETRNHSLWNLCSAFCNILPKLSIEPAVLADALEIILQTPNGGIPIYTAIENLAACSQESADALYREFIAEWH